MRCRAGVALLCAALLASGAAGADAPRRFTFDDGAGFSGSATHYRFSSRHSGFLADNGTPVSRFLLTRRAGPGALHYGSTLSDDETHYYAGVTLGGATLAYYQGRAKSFSRVNNPLYEDLNQYFFHGGRRAAFEFQGAAASLALPGGLAAQLAVTGVAATGVADRQGRYLGLSYRQFEAGAYTLERAGERVGRGLNLGFGSGPLALRYQEIRSAAAGHVRRAALTWRAPRRGRLSLELEATHNPLYAGAGEQRIMLRWRQRLGGAVAFAAAEQGAVDEHTGFGKALGIGAGLGAAAVALSSGDSDDDRARRFAARNDAALDVLNRTNPQSVRLNIEHGGWVYRNADNSFSHTPPVTGTVNSVNLGAPAASVPVGSVASASYHTHGGPDPRFDNEHFSAQDLRADRRAGVDGYLGTPAGFMKLHVLAGDRIRVIGRINN